MRTPVPADDYTGFNDLARAYREGVDYAVVVQRPAAGSVAVIAPHAGRIEGGTSEAARAIAGAEHGLYLFEGLRTTGDNFHCLHLTSRRFDEPRCLDLIAECEVVVAVHGYADSGADVLLGGLDEPLKHALHRSFSAHGLTSLVEGHRYPGRDPKNVCNRGRNGRGVQLELSYRFRHARDYAALATAVRSVIGPHGGS